MKIYGERLSRTERVLWAADECGLEYEHIPVQVNGEKGEALLAINPDGAIPTIDDDGFIISQSWAINQYLARKYGRRSCRKNPGGRG
jgi:glutathione S-transferase